MTLFFISFIAGLLTLLAPCILPIIPVVVGHSLSDMRVSSRRLLVVVGSLFVSVVFFTILIKASTLLISIPATFWPYFSGAIILLFGLITIFPALWDKFTFIQKISQNSNQALTSGYNKNSIWGDVVVGASLGPIFSACSPTYFIILATVLPVSFSKGLLYLLVYAFGLALGLFTVGILGQKIINILGVAGDSRGWFKKIIGFLFIVYGIMLLTGYDKVFQTKLLDQGYFDATIIEQKLLDKNEI